MKIERNKKPPRIPLAFFRWYCHPDLREELEGDLFERYYKQIDKFGLSKARMLFIREVILLFRPAIIGNVFQLTRKIVPDMKKLQWLKLIALNLLIIVCMILPFLPGPYDKLSYGLSGAAQLTGFAGLLLVPIGVLWLIQEIKKIAGNNRPLNNWSNGYYFAITAICICTFISLVLVLMLLVVVGLSAAAIGLAIIIFTIYKLSFIISNLKQRESKSFNAAPLYLLSTPIIAFAVYTFLLGPVSNYGRSYAIKQGEKLVDAIESYYTRQGIYPESIESLYYHYPVPKPSVIGIDEFRYERNGNAYNISFIQWQHVGATEEIVMYNKNDEHNVKGHFASYNADQPHWRYYWLD